MSTIDPIASIQKKAQQTPLKTEPNLRKAIHVDPQKGLGTTCIRRRSCRTLETSG